MNSKTPMGPKGERHGTMTDFEGERLRLQADRVVWREVEDELVVLEVATTNYLMLNGSAKQLWLALVEGTTFEELVGQLTKQYEITSELARTDIKLFLGNLFDRGLLGQETA
jgi:Coenzyme PQQ synthesis protein D (PqqD)